MAQSRSKKSKINKSNKDKDWIQQAVNPEKKGSLRQMLGAKKGEPIAAGKLEKATHSKNPLLKARAVFAENVRNFKKK